MITSVAISEPRIFMNRTSLAESLAARIDEKIQLKRN